MQTVESYNTDLMGEISCITTDVCTDATIFFNLLLLPILYSTGGQYYNDQKYINTYSL